MLGLGVKAPPGWKHVTKHFIFDVKFNFTRKARGFLDEHKTQNLIGSTYTRLVSRKSVIIAFTYAALNGLNVWTADVRNAYLQTPS